MVKYLIETWPRDQLPDDLIRLSDNVIELMNALSIDLDRLKRISEESEYIGSNPKANISPFNAIVLSIVENLDNVAKPLTKRRKKIFLPEEATSLLSSDGMGKLERVLIQSN